MGLSMDESVEIELNIDDSASHCGSDERKNVSRKKENGTNSSGEK